MMLSITFTITRWIALVEATSDRIILNFKDKNYGVEYCVSKKAVDTSNLITGFGSFNGNNTMVTGKNTVKMECSFQTFSMIDKLLNENKTADWNKLASEFTTDVLFELFWALDYLRYEDNVIKEIHGIMFECILPTVVLTISGEGGNIHYGDNDVIHRTHIAGEILRLYLIKYGLWISKEKDTLVVHSGSASEDLKEILNVTKFSEFRILPEALNTDVDEVERTDNKKRLSIILWLFNELWEIPVLNLSGCILMDVHIAQLSKMEYLKVLTLKESTLKLNKSCNEITSNFKSLEELDISGVKLEEVFTDILCRTTSLNKLTMERCFIKPESSLEFIRKQKDLKELTIGRNYLGEEHLNIIFSHDNIKILDMDMCTVDDMYIYGGKAESSEMLKILDGSKVYIEEREMRISLLEIVDESYLKKWMTYNGRLIFINDDGKMKINSLEKIEMNETVSNAVIKTTKIPKATKIWRLSELNGSQVFIENSKEIRIVPSQTSKVLEELDEFNVGVVYFTGKDNGKMNFLDVMKDKGFMKNVEEYNCGQVYFEDKQMDMILSHRGLKKLNMRQCGLESRAIMNIKEKSVLMELDLSNNNMIGEDDMMHVIRHCPDLRKLNMSKCRMLVTGDFKEIQMLNNLEELNIGGNKLNFKCIEYINKHNKLLKLNLEDCGLLKDNLKGIENLKGLKQLYIGYNFISKRDLARIFELKELEVLNISDCRPFGIEDDRSIDINGIKGLCKLKTLDMSNNGLCEEGVNEIFELSELRDLKIGSYWPDCGKLKNICKLSNLEKLNTGKNRMDENDMEGVTRLTNLKELSIPKAAFFSESVFDNIGRLNNSLVFLNLGSGIISKVKIIEKLAELTNLQELRLSCGLYYSEALCGILNRLTRLKALYLGTVNAKNFITCNKFSLASFSKLEVLDLRCICICDEFIVELSKLVKLRELTLNCLGIENVNDLFCINISAFPRGLLKLKVSGINHCYFDLHCSKKQDDIEIFENLEELYLFNIRSISEVIIGKIKGCTKLRRLKLQARPGSCIEYDFKAIEGIATLEELVLKEFDLHCEDIVRLSCLKQLRRLELCGCKLNNKYLNEIEKLKSLEVLNIQSNNSLHSMNGILRLKNLREFFAFKIRFDYDKKGDFELVKGFEKLKCCGWKVYRNNNCIKYKDANFNDVIEEMQREAIVSNWKGITDLDDWYVKIDSVMFFVLSSKLFFIESIDLYSSTKLETHEEYIEILKNCQMLKKITMERLEYESIRAYAFLPLSIGSSIIYDKPFLQTVEMFIDELNIDFANLLLKCEYLHKIVIHTQKYTDGFFATLFENPKENALTSVEFHHYDFNREIHEMDYIFYNFNNRSNMEEIGNYLAEKDVDVIVKAREAHVHIKLYFY